MAIEALGRAAATSLFAIIASGCVATPFYGKPMTERITADAEAFGKAYSEAIDGHILLNILYARDRLPRHYTTVKDITTTQSRSLSVTPSIGGVPLGNPATDTGGAKLWGVGQVGASGSATTTPNYGISPLVSEQFIKGALNPVTNDMFQKYWDGGWPKDVLLAVLATRAVRLPPEGATQPKSLSECTQCFELENSGEDISKARDTEFLALARFIKDYAGDLKIIAEEAPFPKKDAKPIAVLASTASAISPAELAQITQGIEKAKAAGYSTKLSQNGRLTLYAPNDLKQFVILTIGKTDLWATLRNNKKVKEEYRNELRVSSDAPDKFDPTGRWLIELRSFDQAIYYLGEAIRKPIPDDDSVYGPSWAVTAADCPEKGESSAAPLFQVTRRDSWIPTQSHDYPPTAANGGPAGEDPIWAARVNYRGAWYFAGPASPLEAGCDTPNVVDRSATVLTLLGQILEMNRSPDSVILPARLQ